MIDTPSCSPRVSILIVCHRHVDLLAQCLRSLDQNLPRNVAETIVLFNGTPAADLERIAPLLEGASVLASEVNLGFAAGNNRAAARARGEYLVFLNDDTEIQPGWLEALIDAAERHPDAGAVGSRILHPDGTLQEAGSVIWSDGSTIGIGRGLPAKSRRYEYLRQVDYASASSLLMPRSTFDRVGGFDERYFPAYNEDVDLCLSIMRLPQRILYQPQSVVIHHESKTGAEAKDFLILRGRQLLREKWGSYLERFPRPASRDQVAIELALQRARGSPRRLLIVDDRFPDPGMGSGFGRMLDAIRELAREGYAISFHPTATTSGERGELLQLGVEVIEGELAGHLAGPGVIYDAAIISRPHNFKAIRKLRRFQPHAAIIYDAEALFHRRFEREAALLRDRDPAAAQVAATSARHERRRECQIVRTVDRAISVSRVEADLLEKIRGHCPIEVLEPLAPKVKTTMRPFHSRSGALLVAGWLAPYPSPNTDGLEWFVANVLPEIKRRMPWARLSVTGGNPPAEVMRLAGPSLRFLGHVERLSEVYDRACVSVVPVRYGAGIKLKALEALQHGVPVVTTTIGAEGIEGAGGPAVAVSDDPLVFAERVRMLLSDRRAWETARREIARLQSGWSSEERPSWSAIVETALQEKTLGNVALHG